jgi:hypothetical protein
MHVEELFESAIVTAQDGKYVAALIAMQEVLLRDPKHARAWNGYAMLAGKLGNHFVALTGFDQAIICDPSNPDYVSNRGFALMDLDKIEMALAAFEDTLKIKPDHTAALVNRGNALRRLRREQEAVESYRRAIEINPELAQAHFGLATALLALGHLKEGFSEFEWRWKNGSGGIERESSHKRWRGEPLTKRDGLLIYGEQGIGDCIQFARYAPLVKKRWPEAKVYLEVRPMFARLAKTMTGIDGICQVGDTLPDGITHIVPILSLPHILGTDLDSIPSAPSYFHANSDAVKVWEKTFSNLPGLKVGLCWAGRARPNQPVADAIDQRRSMKLADFAPLAGMASFVSLMEVTNPAAQQVHNPPDGLKIVDCADCMDDLYATAALITSLDLVITVDTAIAHLAASLGKETWMLARFDTCWRWLTGRSDSPWYPTMRIFTQPQPGDWASVVESVRDGLQGRKHLFLAA